MCLSFCFTLWFGMWVVLVSSIHCLSQDGQALKAFLSTVPKDESSKLSSWDLSDLDPCHWIGIECDQSSRRVTGIDLTNLDVTEASIPPDFGSLTFLQTLNLSFCGISKQIPPQLGNCTGLKVLDLSHNLLVGSIPPELGRLSNLEILCLNDNNLSGTIPAALKSWSNLRNLYLADNHFSGRIPTWIDNFRSLEEVRFGGNAFSGPIPEEIGNCSNLTVLGIATNLLSGDIPASLGRLSRVKLIYLHENRLAGMLPSELGNCADLVELSLFENALQGPIPPAFGRLEKLEILLLWNNSLSGQIPAEIGSCASLKQLDLAENQLAASIPKDIGNLASLQFLDLSFNKLSGAIPSQIANCTAMVDLELQCNKLEGSIPSEMGLMQNLETLNLWGNSLAGSIPPALGLCKKLVRVDLSGNRLEGTIPAEIFDLQSLIYFNLFNNNLVGSIPSGIDQCTNLSRLRLENNSLSGNIPASLGKLRNLTYLDLSYNQFSGDLPSDLGNAHTLEMLNARNNQIKGTLPSELGGLPKLYKLDLSYNRLQGSIPSAMGNASVIELLLLSGNSFEGQIPAELSNCQNLRLLDLADNHLSGSIPSALGSITSLQIGLNLSFNQLSGYIPTEFEHLTRLESLDLSHNQLTGTLDPLAALGLSFCNVSYNNLMGSVPNTPVFRNMSATSFVGNPNLCRPLLGSDSCNNGQNLRPDGSSNGMHKRRNIIAALLGLSLGLFGLIVALLCVLSSRRYVQDWQRGLESNAVEIRPWKLTTFQRLNFSVEDVLDSLEASNIIGRGNSGSVYKATMPSGEILAVKSLWMPSRTESASGVSLEVEVQTLSRIRHRNIVRLLGYCSNNESMLLLYEYMPNGSLGDVLQQKKGLDWSVRYQIALGAAEGLAYLHYDCVPPIVHRDVKSTNILIDAQFGARLADFGIAKILDASRNAKTVSKIAGSYGYIAPEYGFTLKITTKNDVYAFGVVLLEILTSKKAVEPLFGEGVDLVKWIRDKMKSSHPAVELLEPRLQGMPDPEVQEMLQVMGVALLCTNSKPSERPTMREVVLLLKEVKQQSSEETSGFKIAPESEMDLSISSQPLI